MKRIGLVLSIGLSLCAGSLNVQAHGCGFWPFWGFGLGLGVGAALSWPAYSCAYAYPAYTYGYPPYAYAPPAYAYDPPVAQAPVRTPPPPAPQPPPPPVWNPSTPGAGHWVPDPTPYRYVPSSAAGAAATSPPETVTVTRSVGGVPVYTVSR